MQKWIVTGVSGSERVELLEGIKEEANARGHNVLVHDVGGLIRQEAIKHGIPIVDERFLDMDRSQLRLLRALALKEVRLAMSQEPGDCVHLIGVHATFRWKGRLIPGISYQDVIDIGPDGFLSVVRNVKDVLEKNQMNPKWDSHTLPTLEETQEWMMVEEFVSEVLAEVVEKPMFIVARDHNISNLADLLFSEKKRIYLSYPISLIERERPELLAEIQGPILQRLEKLFVVFNPMSIEDMPLVSADAGQQMPELVEQLTSRAKQIIKTRTIERDFQWIDQSDAVVVLYLTDKVSPGVLAEVYYAHRNLKPVFMVFEYRKSPFIEDAVTVIEPDLESLMARLHDLAGAS